MFLVLGPIFGSEFFKMLMWDISPCISKISHYDIPNKDAYSGPETYLPIEVTLSPHDTINRLGIQIG